MIKISPFKKLPSDKCPSSHTGILEPVGPAILSMEPCLTIGQAASDAALAFG